MQDLPPLAPRARQLRAMLSKAFVDENFRFYSATLAGRPGAAAALEALRRSTPTATSAKRSARRSSKETFGPQAKADMLKMVRDDRGRARARHQHSSTG